jgi:transposase
MPVMDERCAGLDVHKTTVVAGVLSPAGQGGWGQASRTVGTMTVAGLARSDWLRACGCPHVAIASPGDAWQPAFNLLASTCEVWLVHAQHVKAGPGRKTAGQEAAWRVELLPHGLWRARCIPPVAPRELRDVTRERRTCIQARVTRINRGQTLLAAANITLAAVAAASMGVAGRALLAALRTGHAAPQALAELATGRGRSTRDPLTKALAGRVKPHPRLVLTEFWWQMDGVDDTMARCDAQLHAICGPVDEAVRRLETIPGGARRTADIIVAASGTAMTRLPRADHLASGAGVPPVTIRAPARVRRARPARAIAAGGPPGARGSRGRPDERPLSQGAIPTPGGAAWEETRDARGGPRDRGPGV